MAKKKHKILAYGDSPTTATGFATVMRNLLREIHATGEFDIDILGINYYEGYYDREEYPYRIVPAMKVGERDFYGRERLIYMLMGQDKHILPPWDIFFSLQDPFVIEEIARILGNVRDVCADPTFNDGVVQVGHQRIKLDGIDPEMAFKWVGYWPVDSELKQNWVQDSMLLSDFPVAYTEYGKAEIEKHNYDPTTFERLREIDVIPHGVNLTDFYPINKDEKKKFRELYFEGKVKDTDFLIVNISRNQPRKDVSRTMAIFKEFQKTTPNAKLYLHMKKVDAGGNLEEIARSLGLKLNEDYFVPANFDENQGVSLDTLNKIYNMADVCITSTLGEGWGFILTEAMAAKSTILAPNNTSVPEILGEGERGYIYGAGTTTSEFFCMGSTDNERLRPLGNVDSAVEQLQHIYKNPTEALKKKEKGYQYVQTLSWKKVAEKWFKVFEKALKEKADSLYSPVQPQKENILEKAIIQTQNANV